ncbi:MAG: hypothetical protein ACQESR_09875 [Planctomycetota bacterium]
MIQSGEGSTIPKDIAAILDHMNIKEEAWLDTVRGYDELFCHVVGSCCSMGEAAKRMEASQLKRRRRQPPRVQIADIFG